jgi:hypothetical protein
MWPTLVVINNLSETFLVTTTSITCNYENQQYILDNIESHRLENISPEGDP